MIIAVSTIRGHKFCYRIGGNIDRVIRLTLVIAITALYFSGTISGATAIVLGMIATVLLIHLANYLST